MNDDINVPSGDTRHTAPSERPGNRPQEWIIPPALIELWEAGQADVVIELVQLFLADTTERLNGLREACALGDMDQLRRMAHSLKGSCSQMGEDQIAALSRNLEEQAKAGSVPESAGILTEMTRQFEISGQAIRAFLEKHA